MLDRCTSLFSRPGEDETADVDDRRSFVTDRQLGSFVLKHRLLTGLIDAMLDVIDTSDEGGAMSSDNAVIRLAHHSGDSDQVLNSSVLTLPFNYSRTIALAYTGALAIVPNNRVRFG